MTSPHLATTAPATGQLVLRAEPPAGTPPLVLRARHQDVLRAVCDWSRHSDGWRSANGWTVRPEGIHQRGRNSKGWAAYAPDGVPEWWAEDAVTAMTRAEGGL